MTPAEGGRMNYEGLRRIAESVGERSGWDFSRVRDERDPVPWDYSEVVRRYLRPEDRVLDVGTGGGEIFIELAAEVRRRRGDRFRSRDGPRRPGKRA